MPAASSAAAASDRVLEISRVIDAPRALVFRAWTEPQRIARWWGPRGFVTTQCGFDMRPGGAYCACMRAPDGREHCRSGVYREIVAPERLVFTYAWEDQSGQRGPETIVTVSFAELGEKTRLTLHQAVFESADSCAAHREGWTSCLERFAEYLASQKEGALP
jgi:uncharacterized protein YndB with AHSA1/START domain